MSNLQIKPYINEYGQQLSYSGRLRPFFLEIEEKVHYKELPFFVKKFCQLHIIFHKMYCEQEYLLSDNIITMVTILVCALTVTKYDLP